MLKCQWPFRTLTMSYALQGLFFGFPPIFLLSPPCCISMSVPPHHSDPRPVFFDFLGFWVFCVPGHMLIWWICWFFFVELWGGAFKQNDTSTCVGWDREPPTPGSFSACPDFLVGHPASSLARKIWHGALLQLNGYIFGIVENNTPALLPINIASNITPTLDGGSSWKQLAPRIPHFFSNPSRFAIFRALFWSCHQFLLGL